MSTDCIKLTLESITNVNDRSRLPHIMAREERQKIGSLWRYHTYPLFESVNTCYVAVYSVT